MWNPQKRSSDRKRSSNRRRSSNRKDIIVTRTDKTTFTIVSRDGLSLSDVGTKLVMVPLNGKGVPKNGEEFYLRAANGKRYLKGTKFTNRGSSLEYTTETTQTWKWNSEDGNLEFPLNIPIPLSCIENRNPLQILAPEDDQTYSLSSSNSNPLANPMESPFALTEFVGSNDTSEGTILEEYICTEMGPFDETSSKGGMMSANGFGNNFWPKNQVLTISLMDTSSSKKLMNIRLNKIKRAISAWEQCCSIKFKFLLHNNRNALIRITFIRGGSLTVVGKYNAKIKPYKATMNLGNIDENENDDEGTIKHEFGHVLGLCHEHQHPDAKIKWNLNELYKYYRKCGWNKEKVDINIVHRYTHNQVTETDYDPKSIMHYEFTSIIAGKKYKRNEKLSYLDKKFVNEIYGPPSHKSSGILTAAVIFFPIVLLVGLVVTTKTT